jgi:hypothetical protein
MLTIALTPLAHALIAIATPVRAALAPLLLRALARRRRCAPNALNRRSFRPCPTAAATAAARAIARGQRRKRELPAGRNRFDADASRGRFHGRLAVLSRPGSCRFIRRVWRCCRIWRSASRVRAMTPPAASAPPAMRIT